MNRLTRDIKLVDEQDIYKAADLPAISSLRDKEYSGKLQMITEYQYDILGNRIKQISPLAFAYPESDTQNRNRYTTTYTYDALNRLERIYTKYQDKDVYTGFAYDKAGNKTCETDERGNKTTFTYDKLNRLETTTDALNNTYKYTYDKAGNKLTETNAKNDTMTYAYDKLNRVSTITDAYNKVISSKEYDENGNVIKDIDTEGYKSGSSNATRYGTQYTYNLANLLITKITPEAAAKGGITAKYSYNPFGEVLTQTDGTGNTTTYEYDNAGRLTKVTDPTKISVKYTYDKLGNKQTMTNGKGKLTSYSYTAYGKLKAVTNPDNKTATYKYDLSGALACATDEKGNNTVYTYDNMGQLTEKKVPETGDTIKYSYDEAGNRTGMEDESGTTVYTYDANNRLTGQQKNGQTRLKYDYDTIGNISKVTDTKGNETSYTYDKSSRMETVTRQGQTTTYSYDDSGRRTKISYPGGVTENYTYDKDNQLTELHNKKSNGAVISEYSYQYDLAGRQTSKTDSYGTTNYSYDKAGRVTKVATPGKTTIYTYDNNGNRANQAETYTSAQPSGYIDEATSKEIQYILKKSIYTYSNSDQLTKLAEVMYDENSKEVARKTTKYVYDNNGNQLKQISSYTLPDNTQLRPVTKGTAYGSSMSGSIDKLIEKTSYTYDGFNRLKKSETVKDGKQTTAEYTYNGDDLRESKAVSSSDKPNTKEITNYLYDRQYVILETDGAGNTKASYIKGINYIAKLDSTNKASYYLFNGHGDVVQTVDAAGTIQNQYDYDIWGNPTLTIEVAANAIRYSGEFMDEETGLYYLRARYYDPYIGRFTTEDSYWGEDENPLSLNLYTYCSNDPIQYTDPSGHLQQGDQKLTQEAQAQIVDLTNQYFSATTKEEKDAIHDKAEAIRNNTANQTTTNNTGVNSDFYNSFNNAVSSGGSASTAEWNSFASSFGVAGTLNFDNSVSMNTLNVKQGYDAIIYNSGTIGTITAGSGSNVSINNSGIMGINNSGNMDIANSGIMGIENNGRTNITNYGYMSVSNNGNMYIDNYKEITSMATGKGSITNIFNYDTIDEFVSGDNSRNYINNTSLGRILSIVTGTKSNTKILNFGFIDEIHTGQESRNAITNKGIINWLNTGFHNSSKTYGNSIIKSDGGGTTIVTLFNPKTYETVEVDSKDNNTLQSYLQDGFTYDIPINKIIEDAQEAIRIVLDSKLSKAHNALPGKVWGYTYTYEEFSFSKKYYDKYTKALASLGGSQVLAVAADIFFNMKCGPTTVQGPIPYLSNSALTACNYTSATLMTAYDPQPGLKDAILLIDPFGKKLKLAKAEGEMNFVNNTEYKYLIDG